MAYMPGERPKPPKPPEPPKNPGQSGRQKRGLQLSIADNYK